jgi:hypothetical protein
MEDVKNLFAERGRGCDIKGVVVSAMSEWII